MGPVEEVSIFHRRDLFGYCAARLVSRTITYEEVGFRHGDKIRTLIYHNGQIVFDDKLFYYDSFGMADDHTVMIYINEVNKIALAEVVGNLEKSYKLGYGPDYIVEFVRQHE